MKKMHWLLIAVAGLVAAAGLWRAYPSDMPAANDTAEAARHYRLALTVRDETRLPVARGAAVPVTAEVRLQTDLFVSAPGASTRRLRFARVDAASLAMSDDGRRASVASSLEGFEALVVLNGDGSVAGVRVPIETALPVERFVKLVASELAWTRPAQDAVLERTRLGEAQSIYVGARRFERTRRGFRSWAAFDALGLRGLRAEIKGGARGEVDTDGMLTALTVDEVVVAYDDDARLLRAQTRLDLALLGRAAPSVRTAPFGPLRTLVDHPTSAQAETRARDKRIAGLTAEALLSSLDRTGASGELPNHAQALVRATALIRKEPALIERLGERFRAERTNDAERTLLLDLLVGAGTAEAQTELVALLREPLVRAHPDRHLWDQRVSFLQAPTPATVAYATAAFAQRAGVDRTTAAYVLGAVASNQPDGDAASHTAAPLAEQLSRTTATVDRAHLISALGNAGRASLVETIAPYADASEPELRLAAAKALRKTDVRDARSTLVRLSADSSAVVQRRALLSLTRMSTLSSEELDTLGASVRRSAVAETSLGALVNLMAAQPCSTQRNAVLRAVRERPKEGGAVIDARTRALEGRCG